ncbi:hypothetical protein L198_01364 [Cryptococcus wingfieldii CBS 7118]|uniref:G-patch domain-containing protein n=1 Tax=Cryptococcus wingfieldii CBS 7118 TaxID=1295528 RepID=A0A1E3K1R1_9TREE|nr:hypothetical protein L198_01364 [Cryptococcus wingfieldii CBS 7118]ODO06132.1 hypothetical protein L198_01364 [Cryptococcus wingfieldii CBS 7118]
MPWVGQDNNPSQPYIHNTYAPHLQQNYYGGVPPAPGIFNYSNAHAYGVDGWQQAMRLGLGNQQGSYNGGQPGHFYGNQQMIPFQTSPSQPSLFQPSLPSSPYQPSLFQPSLNQPSLYQPSLYQPSLYQPSHQPSSAPMTTRMQQTARKGKGAARRGRGRQGGGSSGVNANPAAAALKARLKKTARCSLAPEGQASQGCSNATTAIGMMWCWSTMMHMTMMSMLMPPNAPTYIDSIAADLAEQPQEQTPYSGDMFVKALHSESSAEDPKVGGKAGGAGQSARPMEGKQVGFGADKIGNDNVGHKLLSKMGWAEGEKIGKAGGSGIDMPIVAVVKNTRKGLGG